MPYMSSQAPRPSFNPSPCFSHDIIPPLSSSQVEWVPVLSCLAGFEIEYFNNAVLQLVQHPEYNSTLILRSETLDDGLTPQDAFGTLVPDLSGFKVVRSIHRRLLPRRPGRDPSMDQLCTFYALEERMGGNGSSGDADPVSCMVLTPIVDPVKGLPFYHPSVSHLAFRYIRSDEQSADTLRIEAIPLANSDPRSLDISNPSHRTYRISLSLLETIHRYGWGHKTHYKKRVVHDALIPREIYQDMYLIMRERYKHIVDHWHEDTDPLKHVFEDIGIATFLMLLWKYTFGDSSEPALSSHEAVDGDVPWRNWPQPPGGFVDIGCGNGLLTHILVSEGYLGQGFDVRARHSWKHYPQQTQDHLHVHSFDPLSLASGGDSKYFTPGTFIIANHADELTPWTPLLASLTSSSGYISLPCCAWSFDCKFERSQANSIIDVPFSQSISQSDSEADALGQDHQQRDFVESLNLGGDGGNTSSYSVYRIWLARLSCECDWVVECENLRIPSTRNWALIGRRHISKEVGREEAIEGVRDIIERVRERGLFKPRKPEGKAGDH